MSESFYGYGNILFDRRDSSGNLTGLRAVGSCSKMELQSNSEIIEQQGRGLETLGKTIASVIKPGNDTFAASLDQVDKENMAIAFLGQVVADNQSSGSVDAGSPLALVAHLGRQIEIGYESLSTVVVKDETDTTTHVLGTDYNLNAELGLIEPLVGGGIAEDDVLHLSFDYAEVNRDKIEAGSNTLIEGRLVLFGINLATNKRVKVEIDDLQIKPSSVIDFLADEFLPLELEGTCRVSGGNPPFVVYAYN